MQNKRGRPTKYSKEIINCTTKYTNEALNKGEFPTIEGLAMHLELGTRTLYDWEKIYDDFSQTMDKLRDVQRQLLITGGLTNKYSTRFAMFLLKATHGMTEKEPLITASQNNYANIAPGVLAEALKMMNQE